MAAYLTVLLLTSYGLAPSYLGVGFVLSLANFVTATVALETSRPYPAQLGSSRTKTFSAITEPVVLLVVLTVASWRGMFRRQPDSSIVCRRCR